MGSTRCATAASAPPDKQERIFRAFEQEDASTTRKYGGIDLGLTIAARLATLMDGENTLDSVPGKGSTFAFMTRFVLQPKQLEITVTTSPVVLRDVPVLIVADNATTHVGCPVFTRGRVSRQPTESLTTSQSS